MTQAIFLAGKLPSLNDLLDAAKQRRGNWSGYAEMKAAHERDISFAIKAAKLRPVVGACVINFQWHEDDKRRDPDNCAAGGRKIILDALVRTGILKSDGWAGRLSWSDQFEVSTTPGVQVTLTDLG